MLRIIISLMVFLLMNERGNAFIPDTFLNITNIISWGNKIFNEETLYGNVYGNTFDYISIIKLNKMLDDVERISNDFDAILYKMNQTQSQRMNYNVDDRSSNYACFISKNLCRKKVPDQSHELALFEFISNVNNFYTNIRKELIASQPKYQSLKTLMSTILNNISSLSTTLEKIYQLIIPTTNNNMTAFIQLTMTNTDLFPQYDCNKYISVQQRMFVNYINLIIAEMKGLTILTYVHSIKQRLYKEPSISQTLMKVKQNFEKRTMDYYKHVHVAMALLPRDIHRCEIRTPRRGDNFIEFVQYHQAKLISSSVLDTTNPGAKNCHEKCENIDLTETNRITHENIHNCQTLGDSNDVDVCVSLKAPRKYSWWRTQHRTYGNREECAGRMSFGKEHRTGIRFCYMCMCSVVDTLSVYKNKILRISETAQISDIAINMIVTGVKFVIHDKAVHLQIQQSIYIPGEIIDSFTKWKKLDDYSSTTDTKFRYSALAEFSGQLHIDDVMLPPKFAVTGVRLASRKDPPAGFYLQVHGTPIDFQTGELNPAGSRWFTANDWSRANILDYKNDRFKVDMEISDDPTECSGYNYERQTNKLIQFHHSSVNDDAGQSTIPFIDAQPVEIYPSFPLGGIGLFYRRKFGCGGYIAPRLFTIDMSQYT